VLDGDPLTCPQDVLKDLRVDMAIVGGAVAFERTAALAENPRRPSCAMRLTPNLALELVTIMDREGELL
jgi:hypothetical protein